MAGGTCLLIGFLGQLLGATGFGASGQAATVLSALVAIEVAAILIAYPVYGLTYVTSINPDIRRNADLLTTEGMSYRRRPDGIWF